MMRILLFVATNLAVVLVASITLSLFGFNGFMAANGVDLNLSSLLVFCAVFGFAGSLVSLFISKWMAKMSTGTQIITQPRTRHEQWLLQTVEELSREAGMYTAHEMMESLDPNHHSEIAESLMAWKSSRCASQRLFPDGCAKVRR